MKNNSLSVMIHGTRVKTHILYSNKITGHKGCALCWSREVPSRPQWLGGGLANGPRRLAWVLSGDEIVCLCLSSVIIDGRLLIKYGIFKKRSEES